MPLLVVRKSKHVGSDGVPYKNKETYQDGLVHESDRGTSTHLEQELREGYSEFETGYRGQHPLLWWSSLLAPPVVSAMAITSVFFSSGPEYTQRLLSMAVAALWFFGRFVILGGHDPEVAEYSGDMTSGELFLMVCFMDVMVAFFLAFHIGYLFRLPIVGPRILGLVADARFILDAQHWVKRAAFFGVVAFVSFPLQATGSVGGTLFGRMLGMSRIATFLATVTGSLFGNGLMYLGSDVINTFVDKNHPLVKYGGIILVVVLISIMNWWYQRTKRNYLRSGNIPQNLSVEVSPEQV
jgi:uncharacterized membrane protein